MPLFTESKELPTLPDVRNRQERSGERADIERTLLIRIQKKAAAIAAKHDVECGALCALIGCICSTLMD